MDKESVQLLTEIRDDIREMKTDLVREMREVKIRVMEVFK